MLQNNQNFTQRLNSDLIGISPSKRGINMIPIRSKQDGSPDSFDKDNIGDEVHADLIPDVKRKKNKRNITQDFNTNGNFPQIFKKSSYNYEYAIDHSNI